MLTVSTFDSFNHSHFMFYVLFGHHNSKAYYVLSDFLNLIYLHQFFKASASLNRQKTTLMNNLVALKLSKVLSVRCRKLLSISLCEENICES